MIKFRNISKMAESDKEVKKLIRIVKSRFRSFGLSAIRDLGDSRNLIALDYLRKLKDSKTDNSQIRYALRTPGYYDYSYKIWYAEARGKLGKVLTYGYYQDASDSDYSYPEMFMKEEMRF